MKSSYLLAIVVIVSAALGIGWIVDKKTPPIATSPLQVPDNIDYYLSNLKFQSMNQQGSLHYQLQSPYLEHYIQQDTSILQQPSVLFNGDKSSWFINAERGSLQHKKEQFELRHNVKLERDSPQQPMLLTSAQMLLKAQVNVIEIPQQMYVTTRNLQLQAASAVLNINKNYYQFKRVNATYTNHNNSRNSGGNS